MLNNHFWRMLAEGVLVIVVCSAALGAAVYWSGYQVSLSSGTGE